MESELEKLFRSKHSRIQLEVVDSSGSSKGSTSDEDVAEGRGSSKPLAVDPDVTDIKYHRSVLAKTLSSSSVSSSSSDSSSGDFFQVDTSKLMSRAGLNVPPKLDKNPQLASKHEENDASFSTVLTSLSQVSDITDESTVPNIPPAQCPPTPQVMERSMDYDPYRIPPAVFASKPTTPLEWSLASNESLFSIHVGNISFSRDHFIMMGGDMNKSRELTKSTKSGEKMVFNQIPPSKIQEINRKNDDKGKIFKPSEDANGLIRDVHKKKTDDLHKKKIVPREEPLLCSSNYNLPDGNGTNIRSSDECPKKKKCAWPCLCCFNCSFTFCACRWPFRCCSNRSWGFCSCKWPKCSCKWPRCSCTWPRCSCTAPCRYCSNCSCAFCTCTWPRCHCSWPRCHCCSCSQSFCHCCNCSQSFSDCCNCSCKPIRQCCHCSQACSNCWSCSRKRLCCFPCIIFGNTKRSDSKADSETPKHQQKHACKWMSCNWFSCFRCCSCPRCSCWC